MAPVVFDLTKYFTSREVTAERARILREYDHYIAEAVSDPTLRRTLRAGLAKVLKLASSQEETVESLQEFNLDMLFDLNKPPRVSEMLAISEPDLHSPKISKHTHAPKFLREEKPDQNESNEFRLKEKIYNNKPKSSYLSYLPKETPKNNPFLQ